MESGPLKKLRRWLWFDPAHDSPPAGPVVPAYTLHTSANFIYLCGGRLRIGKSPVYLFSVPVYALPLTVLGMLFPMGLFLGLEGPWFWHNISPGIVVVFAYVWLVTFVALLRAGMCDPGVLPLNVHLSKDYNALPEEYYQPIATTEGPNQHLSQIKYCESCFIWRPVRASHCSRCGVCVAGLDHHCPWLGICVGERNYVYFAVFLLLLSITQVYLISMAFYRVGHSGVSNARWALFLAIYASLPLPYSLLLLIFHVYLGLTGITTREYLNMEIHSGHPFLDAREIPYYSNNWVSNFRQSWCRPRGWPLWRARGKVDVATDFTTRKIVVGAL